MTALPAGPLAAWYGDDFTGAAATMEVFGLAGLKSMVFLDLPDAARLKRFPDLRGIGVAGTARAESPEWMRSHLPEVFRALRSTGAPVVQYKICSTLDSSPSIGSIGTAMDIAAEVLGTRLAVILPAAPPMGRYQAFGTLFATAPGGLFRLDRHPIMSRHPVTPMTEADVAAHISRQTSQKLAGITVGDIHSGQANRVLLEMRAAGVSSVTVDMTSMQDMAAVGRLCWDLRGGDTLFVASQGLEYALLAHWQECGALRAEPAPASAGDAGPIAVVSGSVSMTTAAQIADAIARGFHEIALDPVQLASTRVPGIAATVHEAVHRIRQGQDVVVHTARGPDDPAVAHLARWLAETGLDAGTANRRIGRALGEILKRIVVEGGVSRAVIAGGDTSGHAARQLGVTALSVVAATVPGAALCRAHSDDHQIDGLQLALKGGQMGTPDYFYWIRRGGGPRPT